MIDAVNATASSAGQASDKPTSTTSLGLDKTKLKNEMSVLRQKHTECVAAVKEDSKNLLIEIESSYGDLDDPLCSDLVAEIRQSTREAELELTGDFKLKMDEMTLLIDDVNCTGTCKAATATVRKAVSEMKKKTVKKFNVLKGRTKKHLYVVSKRQSPAKPKSEEALTVPSCPQAGIVAALEETNVGESLFETKSGIRACRLRLADDMDPAAMMRSNAIVKRNIKMTKASLKTTGFDWAQSSFAPQDPKTKKLLLSLRKLIDTQALTKHILPDEPWACKIHTPDVCELGTSHYRFGATHYASVEARLYLEGKETVMGIKFDAVEGSTWNDKRRTLACYTIDNLKELITKADGFVVKAEADTVVIYPSGHIIISTSSVGATYIRWAVSSEQTDSNRVVCILDSLVKEFAEIRMPASGYSQFLEFLRSNVVG